MTSLLLLLAVALLPPANPAALASTSNATVCDGKPVIMLISGIVHDRARILAYGDAIKASGLYEKLGGYYLASPRSLATFEGTPPANQSVLMVRFPCYAHARAFWFSQKYQKDLIPLRQNPNAGDFTVTVYPEIAPPAAISAQLQPGGYRIVPPPSVISGIPQVPE